MEPQQRGTYIDNFGVYHDHFNDYCAVQSAVSPSGTASVAVYRNRITVRDGSEDRNYAIGGMYSCLVSVSDGGVAICTTNEAYSIAVYSASNTEVVTLATLLQFAGRGTPSAACFNRFAISGRRDSIQYVLACAIIQSRCDFLQLQFSFHGELLSSLPLHSCYRPYAFDLAISTATAPVSVIASLQQQKSAQYDIVAFDPQTRLFLWKRGLHRMHDDGVVVIRAIGTGNIAVAVSYRIVMFNSDGVLLLDHNTACELVYNIKFSPDANWLVTKDLGAPAFVECIGIGARVLMIVLCSRRKYRRKCPSEELWKYITDEFLS